MFLWDKSEVHGRHENMELGLELSLANTDQGTFLSSLGLSFLKYKMQ